MARPRRPALDPGGTLLFAEEDPQGHLFEIDAAQLWNSGDDHTVLGHTMRFLEEIVPPCAIASCRGNPQALPGTP